MRIFKNRSFVVSFFSFEESKNFMYKRMDERVYSLFFFFHSVPFSGDEQRINKFGQKRRYAYASIVSQLECFISVESCGYLFLFKISDIICLKSNFFSENNLFQSYSMDRAVNFSPFVFFIRSRYLVITRTFKTIRLQL